MIQLYKVSSELLLPPLVAPAARSSLHSISKTDCLGLWRVYSTGRWAKKKEKMLKVPLLLWLRSRTGLLKLPARTSTALFNEHIIYSPRNKWLTRKQRREPKQAEPTPSPSMQTYKSLNYNMRMQLSAEKALYCCVLSGPWVIPVLHQSAMIEMNIFTARAERNTIYTQEWYSLFPYLQIGQKGTQIQYLSHMPPEKHILCQHF